VRGQWIMFQEVAPAKDRVWAVGYLAPDAKGLTSLSWFYTEDEARLAHHRLEH
jgi:hypothetical protein